MGFRNLRRYDVQAGYALACALASLVPFLGVLGLAVRNFDSSLRQIVYGAKGYFLPAFLGCIVVSVVPAAIGFLLGWNSAGQRRNERPVRSWMAFFVGGSVLTLNLILLIAFLMLRLEHPG